MTLCIPSRLQQRYANRSSLSSCLCSSLSEYNASTSLHGLKFTTEPGRHPAERAFWVVAVVTSWAAAIALNYMVTNSKSMILKGRYFCNPMRCVTS